MLPWETWREEGISDLLLQYRAVNEYPLIPDPCPKDEVILYGLRTLYATKNHLFTDRHAKLEEAFDERKKAEALLRVRELEERARGESTAQERPMNLEWDRKSACPVCKRPAAEADLATLECVERVERWLEETRGE